MKVIDDGVIKYDRSNFTYSAPLELTEYSDLEYWRQKFFSLNLIGEYSDSHIGFGNLSKTYEFAHFIKTSVPQFIITGTQTGKLPTLDGNHYTRVLNYNIEEQKIQVLGPIEASSEALTHASIYLCNKNIKSIFHIHSPKIWQGMINDKIDHTPFNISYGTVEMAKATQECIAGKNLGSICMHGHQDGVIAYGRNLEETGNLILNLYFKYL